MNSGIAKALADFEANRESVYRILTFDESIIQVPVQLLRSFDERNRRAWEGGLKGHGHLPHDAEYQLPARLSVDSIVRTLENIRDHGSLRRQYRIMFNQCIVLLVAHFASAAKNLFQHAIEQALSNGASEAAMKFEVRARAGDLQGLDRPLHSFIADQIASSADISFQDMNSIRRAFRNYFNLEIARDECVNDIVAAHAARHVIVHSGDSADGRFMNQLRDAKPRRLLAGIVEGEKLELRPEDIRIAGDAMGAYLDTLSERVNDVLRRHGTEEETAYAG